MLVRPALAHAGMLGLCMLPAVAGAQTVALTGILLCGFHMTRQGERMVLEQH